MAIRRGSDASEAAQARSAYRKTEFITLKDGDQMYLRMVEDHTDWLVTNMHLQVPTRQHPDEKKRERWPKKMSAVCRYDEAIEGSECYICDYMVPKGLAKKPQARTWTQALVREPVIEAGRGVPGQYKTVMVQDTTDDKVVIEIPRVGILNFAHNNCFAGLRNLADAYGGTVMDRDFLFSRRGTELDTNYYFVGMDRMTMPDGRNYDLRNADFFAEVAPFLHNMEEFVLERGGDKFYATFFDLSKEFPVDATPHADAEGGGTQDVSPEDIAAVTAKLNESSAYAPNPAVI